MTSQQLLDSGFSGEILTPEATGFAEASARYTSIAESVAKFIVFPKSAKDVSLALAFVQKAKLNLAVRGGGNHPGAVSSAEDGVTIDLKELNTVKLNNESETITVGGGCRWADVYSAVKGTGRICVGGGVHMVGVGGHLTGGGWGPLSHKYGVASDNIVSATVVVADGRILTANKDENADLFWAIKGGSSQFGVVTEFILRTYLDPGKFFTRPILFPEHAVPTLAPIIRDFVNAPKKEDEYILVFVFFARTPLPDNKPFVIVNFVGIAPQDPYQERIQAFLRAADPIADTYSEWDDFYTLSHCMDHLLMGSPRRIISAMPLITGFWPDLMEGLWEKWIKHTSSDADASRAMLGMECHAATRRSPELSCYSVNEPIHHAIMITSAHHNPGTDEKAKAWLRDSANFVQKQQDSNGVHLPLAGNGTSIPVKPEEIWGDSYPRLQQIKAKYDPQLVFNKFHPIQPAST